MVETDHGVIATFRDLENPSTTAKELVALHVMSYKTFLKDLKKGDDIEQICLLTSENEGKMSREHLRSSSTMDESVLEQTKIQRFEAQGWDALKANPMYELLKVFEDVFPDEIPCELPKDKGVQHEIDLVPGTKYCVTRQWPLPQEQVDVIDKFFEARYRAGQMRESKSPHPSPTFCVRKATGG